MARVSTTKIWDNKEQKIISVNNDYINKYKNNVRYSTDLPSSEEKNRMVESANNGVQSYYKGTGGVKTDPSSSFSQSSAGSLSNSDIQDEIQKLKQAQIDQAAASLGKSRDSQLSNLNAEKEQIAPTYYGKRNAASTQSQLNARNFAEYMAGRGGTTAGSNAQVELSRLGNLEGQLGSLNRDEASAMTENARRVTDVNNAYASDVVAAQAGAEATALQNTINQMNADRAYQQAADQFAKTFGLSEAGVTGVYNGSPTLSALAQRQAVDQFNKTFGLQEGQLLGTYNGQDTLANKQYQTGVNQWQQEHDAQQAQREFEQWLQKQQLALSQAKTYSSGGSGGSITQSSSQGIQNQRSAEVEVQNQINQGISPGNIQMSIESQADELKRAGINVNDLIKYIYQYAGLETTPGEL